MDHHRGPWTLRRKLRCRCEGYRRRLAAQIIVFGVWNDADDLVDSGGIVRLRTGAQGLSNRTGAAQKLPNESLVHKRDSLGGLGVVYAETSARQQRNAHRFEVARTNPGEPRTPFDGS